MTSKEMQSAENEPAKTKPAKKRRRWLQFTMRGLIVLMVLAAIGAFWLRNEVQRAREQRLATEKATELHANLQYANSGPGWLESLLGEDIFLKVERAETRQSTTTDLDMAWLAALDDLQVLSFAAIPETVPRPRMGDSTVAHVADMHELRILSVPRFDLSDHGAQALRNHPEMEELELRETLITDAGLAYISGMHKLQRLDLSVLSGVTDAGLIHLRRLKELQSLSLNGTNVSGTGLEHLSQMNSLTALSLSETPLTDEGLRHIGQLKSLGRLEIESKLISNAGIAHLDDMPNLVRLTIKGADITDDSLRHLAGSPNLRELSYHSESTLGDGLADLASLARLRHLDLSGAELNTDGWKALRELPQVTSVSLNNALVTDEHLAMLVDAMPQLEEISLSGTQITDDGVADLARLNQLTRISIRDTKITGAGLKVISRSPILESVIVSGNQMGRGFPKFVNTKVMVEIRDPIQYRSDDVPPEFR